MRKCQVKILVLLILLLSGTGVMTVRALMKHHRAPARIERDFRYQGISMEELARRREMEKGGISGLSDLAGWRYGETEVIREPNTGKKERAGVVWIFGSAALAFPSKVLSGSFEKERK